MAGITTQGLVQELYRQALLKTNDNGPITNGSFKTITDGAGNNTGLELSTTNARITGTLSSANWVSPEAYGAAADGTTDDTAAITSAIAAAGANGTVVFTPGRTYKTTSQITVGVDGLTLWGYGATITSALDTQYRKFRWSGRARGGVYGLRFNLLYSTATTGISQGPIELVNVTDFTVKHCEINDCAKCGVYIEGASSYIDVHNNRFSAVNLPIFSDDASGSMPTYISIKGNRVLSGINGTLSGAVKMSGAGGSENTHAGHVIQGNRFINPGQMGVEIQSWINGVTITGNTIIGAGYGVSVSGCANVAVTGNAIKGCTDYGVELASGSLRCTVTGNAIDGANTSGTATTPRGIIVNDTDFSTVTGNSIRKCTTWQIEVVDASRCVLAGNMSYGCGWEIKNSTDVNVNGNFLEVTGTVGSFIDFDSTNAAIDRVSITGNHFKGSVTDKGIDLYSPANSINNVLIADNTSTGASATGWMYGTTISGGGSVGKVRIRGNYSTGAGPTECLDMPMFNISANKTLDPTHETVLGDATAGVIAATLPDAAPIPGKEYEAVKVDGSANAFNLATTGGQTINGAASPYALTAQWQRVRVISNESNWVIIGT